MQINIEIVADTSAFDEQPTEELRRILETVPRKVLEILMRKPGCVCDAPESADILKDTNGNNCGKLWITEVSS